MVTAYTALAWHLAVKNQYIFAYIVIKIQVFCFIETQCIKQN